MIFSHTLSHLTADTKSVAIISIEHLILTKDITPTVHGSVEDQGNRLPVPINLFGRGSWTQLEFQVKERTKRSFLEKYYLLARGDLCVGGLTYLGVCLSLNSNMRTNLSQWHRPTKSKWCYMRKCTGCTFLRLPYIFALRSHAQTSHTCDLGPKSIRQTSCFRLIIWPQIRDIFKDILYIT